jgi:hypothetical protein
MGSVRCAIGHEPSKFNARRCPRSSGPPGVVASGKGNNPSFQKRGLSPFPHCGIKILVNKCVIGSFHIASRTTCCDLGRLFLYQGWNLAAGLLGSVCSHVADESRKTTQEGILRPRHRKSYREVHRRAPEGRQAGRPWWQDHAVLQVQRGSAILRTALVSRGARGPDDRALARRACRDELAFRDWRHDAGGWAFGLWQS